MAAYVRTTARTSKRLRIAEMNFFVMYRPAVTTILRFIFRQLQTFRDSTAETGLNWRILRQI